MGDSGTSSMREELRTLVDHISESDVATARKLFRALVDGRVGAIEPKSGS
jgi:hypothetical protein